MVIVQPSPGNGYLNGGAAPVMGTSITGAMAGGIACDIYTTAATTAAKPPATENDGGKLPKVSTGAWVTQFFKSGTPFWDANGSKGTYLATVGGWLYTAPPGADKACPHTSSQWLDASPGATSPEPGLGQSGQIPPLTAMRPFWLK